MPSRRRPRHVESPPVQSEESDLTTQPVPSSPNLSTSSPTGPVISNTTPLITLGEMGLLDVLQRLYGTVWVPDSVFVEYQRGRAAHPQRPDLHAFRWIEIHQPPADPLVPTSLDLGERDAIALARAHQASRILLDERSARAVALRLQLTVTGSVGVLLAAKQRNIIPQVKPHLDRAIAQGRYLSPRLYEQVLQQAGESS